MTNAFGSGRTSPIAGVVTWPLEMHGDSRGYLTEVFREEWGTGVQPVQWTVLRTVEGTLRGMDVHVCHDDFQVLVDGRAWCAMKDLRRGSPTEGAVDGFEMSGTALAGVAVPRGVAHGFYFFERSIMVVGASGYYHPADHLPCQWDDPALGIDWPAQPRILSEIDANAPPLDELLRQMAPNQPLWRSD